MEYLTSGSDGQSFLNLGRPIPAETAPPENSGLTIFIAVKEQLGLKLEATRGSVRVMVVDSFEKPSEN